MASTDHTPAARPAEDGDLAGLEAGLDALDTRADPDRTPLGRLLLAKAVPPLLAGTYAGVRNHKLASMAGNALSRRRRILCDSGGRIHSFG
jgi:hypothetical protein